MSSTESEPEEAITKDEITGKEPAPPAASLGVSQGKKRNAFTELMSPKPKVQAKESHGTYSKGLPVVGAFKDRDGLGAYTHNPASYPTSRVVSFNDDFVVINDLYPKSAVHTLLLPRSARSRQHPFEAFEDPAFLAAVQAEARKLKTLVAKELQRRYGKFSESDSQREAVLDGAVEWDAAELPRGRDWEREVSVGIHAHPSMNDLHVHVLSRDMHSDCLKHRKHYNSFNTPFLIDVVDFPLAKDDPRRHPGHAGYMARDLVCWRCGKNFGNKFKQLKEHLAEEFEQWKKI